MQADVFTSDDFSSEALHAVFDAAMFEVKVDDDGNVIVRDKYRVIVSAHTKNTAPVLVPLWRS